jgi:hypothetical protein
MTYTIEQKCKAGGDSLLRSQRDGTLSSSPHPVSLAPKNWIADRHARIAGAIRYLKSQAILVDQVDKRAAIAAYWVSGIRQPQLAEDVIALAKAKGWSE